LFHAWNVKRIRPQSLEPVDYTREMWTRSLWFAEGVTSTYAAYTMVRTGLWSAQQFYGNLSGQINELLSRSAHRWQSAEQSSLDTWLEKYPLYVRPEQSVSYYNKGQLLGLALDIVIRDSTDNRASMDDMLRLLNVKYAQAGKYYGESEALREAAEEVLRSAGAAGQADLRDFFARYVSGTDEIPFSNLLSRAGWTLRNSGTRRAAFGFTISRNGDGPVSIERLEAGSAAQKAGLRDGDILVQLGGEAPPRSPERWLRDRQPEESVAVKIRRGGEEKTLSFALGQSEVAYQVVESADPTEKQRRIRDGILRGITGTAR
jgi:predicted metalloprotease with PDZ domain